ncbi:MAG: hypothetical protein KAR19_18420 [Bacteroidales bacterium]|nr:hypothetical protein [Bacteroidales bacterium]
MESAVRTHNTLKEEIQSVEQYLQNEEFRYNGKLSWECSLDPEVNTNIVVPHQLILTFVEDAIKHGIFHNSYGGKIDVSINKSRIGVLIMVTDNGAKLEDSSGTQNFRKEKFKLLDNYLHLFNKKQTYKVNYQILDRSICETDRTGIRVLITLKF